MNGLSFTQALIRSDVDRAEEALEALYCGDGNSGPLPDFDPALERISDPPCRCSGISGELRALEDRMISRFRREAIAAALGDDRLVDEEEAASVLGISAKELSRKRLAGEIPAGYIGRSPRYSIGVLRRYAREVMTRRPW